MIDVSSKNLANIGKKKIIDQHQLKKPGWQRPKKSLADKIFQEWHQWENNPNQYYLKKNLSRYRQK